MVTNSESRKLNLFAPNDDFKSIEAITCLAFFAVANIPVKKRSFAKLQESHEGKKFQVDTWPVVLERVSTLRKHPTLVASSTPILRFIY